MCVKVTSIYTRPHILYDEGLPDMCKSGTNSINNLEGCQCLKALLRCEEIGRKRKEKYNQKLKTEMANQMLVVASTFNNSSLLMN
jgi:hypothetical protein